MYLKLFCLIYVAMVATAFWEAYSEGRNAWGAKKVGWKKKILGYELTGYHFYLFFLMFPSLLALPFVVNGWDTELFGVILSAYLSGLVLEDFMWYVINPEVKFKEWFTDFSDYYPWFKIKGRKIIPVWYVVGIIISLGSWYYLWR